MNKRAFEKVWVLGKIPTPTNRARRRHWSKNHSDLRVWCELVWAHCGRPPRVTGPVRFFFRIYRWMKIQDPDNAHASLKPLIDAFVRQGWAVDDTAELLTYDLEEKTVSHRDQVRTVVFWARAGEAS